MRTEFASSVTRLSRSQFLKTLGLGALSVALPAGPGLASPRLEAAQAGAKTMKIKDVEIYYNDIELVEPFTVSLGTITNANGVLIRVLTDSGIVGIGESSPIQFVTGETQETNIDVARRLREAFKGRAPLAIESANTLAGAYVHSNPSIVAAFDMAFYDILGKVAGLPVFRLLGGDKATFETDVTLGIDTPEKMALSAKDAVAKGFKTLKVKIGQDPDVDVSRMQAVRAAIGYGPSIRVDGNQGYTVPQAVYALRHMENFKIQFCEQPVVSHDFDGLRQVRQESPIAIMADEALFGPPDAIKLIKMEACDYFNIKLMKAGGISNALKISIIAEAANIRCMLGCMFETRIGLTAAAHVHGARKNIVYADLDGNLSHAFDPVVGGMTLKDGIVTIPESPGLGADMDPAFLKTLKKA
jgi:L-alanine-DL-glutamate epimerase-like enolase superfamily enzyme